jgi:hypothetical protein
MADILHPHSSFPFRSAEKPQKKRRFFALSSLA